MFLLKELKLIFYNKILNLAARTLMIVVGSAFVQKRFFAIGPFNGCYCNFTLCCALKTKKRKCQLFINQLKVN
jgi:hypothetical protein